MNNFYKSTTFKVLLTVAVVLLSVMIMATAVTDGTSPITRGISFIMTPIQKASSYVAKKFDNLNGSFISSKSYEKKVAELEQQIAEYQKQLVDYEKIKKQLNSYEEFLDVKEKNPDFTWVNATVIGRDSADLFGSFTINKGTNDGISVNDSVIYSEYLIGVVTEVSPTSSVCRAITDPSVNVAAYEIRTGEMGYVSSDAKSSIKGECSFMGLPKNTSVSKGGIVCTSGTGGIFPKNLIIGTIETVEQSDTELKAYATLKTAVGVKDIHDCFVITEFKEN